MPLKTMPRESHEAFALALFKNLAISRGHQIYFGQGGENRIPIQTNVYYQFGDLRIELPNCTVIVEVESSGGVTNLAKYWESFVSKRLHKPIKLLHIFRQKSASDYESHMVVWRFLCGKMHEALGPNFEGRWITYQHGSQESLQEALSIFEKWVQTNAA